ncbi:hypothetical protein [Nocardia sp. NPDC004722]
MKHRILVAGAFAGALLALAAPNATAYPRTADAPNGNAQGQADRNGWVWLFARAGHSGELWVEGADSRWYRVLNFAASDRDQAMSETTIMPARPLISVHVCSDGRCSGDLVILSTPGTNGMG